MAKISLSSNKSTKSKSSSSSDVSSLARTLSSVAKTAKSLGIDTSKAESMLKQTKAEGSKAYKGSSYEKEYLNSIPATSLMENKGVANIPAKPVPSPLGFSLNGNNAQLGQGMSAYGQTYDAKTGQFTPVQGTSSDLSGYENLFKEYQSNLEAPPSTDKILRDVERQAGLKAKREAVSGYSGQLNAIVNERDAAKLALEGQGRGQTTGFIGGEQARIEREAAIRALPVQAQLAAAQGDLQMAQQFADRLFQVKSADALAQYQYRTNMLNAVYTFATQQEQRRLDILKTQEDRAFQVENRNITLQNQWAMQALEYGQSGVLSEIMRLDPTKSTFQIDLAEAQSKLRKPVPVVEPKAPTLQNFGTSDNPNWMQWNPTTGSWESVAGVTGGTAATAIARENELIDKATNIQDLISHPGKAGSVGAYGVARWTPFTADKADRQDFIGQVEKLVSGLTLDEIAKKKAQGVSFGALSDTELQKIGEAATAITSWRMTDDKGKVTGYEISEGAFDKELKTLINGINDSLGYDFSLLPPQDNDALTTVFRMNASTPTFDPALDY